MAPVTKPVQTLKDAGYTNIKKIGIGGMSAIFSANAPDEGPVVAIKMIHELATTTESRRFIKEANIMETLTKSGWTNSPKYINRLIDVETAGIQGIVMEYLPGKSYKEAFKTLTTKSDVISRLIYFGKVVELFRQLYENHGVLHRDIKASNIMMSGGEEPKTMVIDFGIVDTQKGLEIMTAPNNVVGTVMTLSPEQMRGRTASVKTEIYALGVLLHNMMSGTTVGPYIIPNNISPVMRIPYMMKEDLSPLINTNKKDKSIKVWNKSKETNNPKYLRKVDQIIKKCVRYKPSYRYKDYAELIAQINMLVPELNDLFTNQNKKKWWRRK